MARSPLCDQIWNRACFGEGSDLRQGDLALGALLKFYGYAMNGGVLHAIESLTEEQLTAASAGYRYFELPGLAAVLDDGVRAVRAGEDLDELEEELDERYLKHVPDDETLVKAFEARFTAKPRDFAPVPQ